MHAEVLEKCEQARLAAAYLAGCSTAIKNNIINDLANSLLENADTIIAANKIDLENLKQKNNYTEAFYDRLLLNELRIKSMAEGLAEIAKLEDPIGAVTKMWKRPNGLLIGLQRVPIGVIGIIYEARPNVTVDAAGLALKAGNAVILRGSSEAIHSNKALVKVMRDRIAAHGLPFGSLALIEDTDRSAANDLMKANGYINLLIPRGGTSLIKSVIENSTVPVVQTGEGNCHIYVDENADLEMALAITVNAKVQRPGVCNAIETLLVHRNIASRFLPEAISTLNSMGVEIRGCKDTMTYSTSVTPARDEDWETEFLDLILAIKIVDSFDEAIAHINYYGTGHSEAIITKDYDRSLEFLNRIDAAAVYINASTRFTDGFEFGLGAEMGISTQKLHVRGPMGLEALTALKYIIFGSGQIRE